MMSLPITTRLDGPCSRVSKNDNVFVGHVYGPWSRVVCTEHPYPRAVLAKSIVTQCFC